MYISKANPLALLFLVSVSTVFCQAQYKATYAVGINAGSFIYQGDLTPSRTGSWKTPGFAWGLTGVKHLTPTLSARLDVGFGKLRGDEARYATPEYRQHRAFAFNNRVTEVIAGGEWNPTGRDRKLSPYVFAGIGYAQMKITRDYSRFDGEYFSGEPSLKEMLAKDAEAPLPKGVAIFPVGVGVKYTLNNRFSLTTEASQRFSRSDYLDGFSYSGNANRKDNYTKFSIGLRYSIGGNDRLGCPVIRE